MINLHPSCLEVPIGIPRIAMTSGFVENVGLFLASAHELKFARKLSPLKGLRPPFVP